MINNKIVIPKEINGETYYPILHERLFSRYYINYSGYIYDALNMSLNKFNFTDMISLNAIDNNEIICIKVQELIWRTFFRFPEGKDFNYNSHGDLEKIKTRFEYSKKENIGYYYIKGVEFKLANFPKDSLLYSEFVNITKSKLIVSENGAIFNLKSKRFLTCLIDSEGYPFIYSKSGIKFRINEILAYTWFREKYHKDTHKIKSMAISEIFVNKNNILIYSESNGKFLPVQTDLVIQNLIWSNQDSSEISRWNRNKYDKYCEDIFDNVRMPKNQLQKLYKSLYNIPLVGFYKSIYITNQGVLISNGGKIIKPYKILFENDSRYPTDILYKIPGNSKIFSIADIFMWAFYRLTREVVGFYKLNIYMDTRTMTPVIKDFYIATSTGLLESNKESGFRINNEFFIQAKIQNEVYYKLFISKYGAIFNTQYNNFISYNVNTINHDKCDIVLYSNKYTKWLDMKYLVFSSWFNINITKSTKLISRNGIPNDISIYNLDIIKNFSYRKSMNEDKFQSIYNRLNDDKEIIMDKLCKIGVSELPINYLPIAEVNKNEIRY